MRRISTCRLFSIALVLLATADYIASVKDYWQDKSNAAHCNATTTTTLSNCIVFSNQSLTLDCSLYPNGTWYKNGSQSPLCSTSGGSVCTLRDVGYIETSGMYCCSSESNAVHHCINVTVLGPPEFVPFEENGLQCDGKVCQYPQESGYTDMTDQISVSVMVKGVGPFAVSWRHNQLLGEEACPNGNINHTVNCDVTKLSETQWKFTYLLKNHLTKSMSGFYFAIVSNLYGKNTSETKVKVDCNTHPSPPTPLAPSANITRYLLKGQSTTLTCSMKISKIDKLGVCYMEKSQSIQKILSNKTLYNQSCAVCSNNDGEKCTFQIPNRTKWTVRRYNSLYLDDCPVNDTIELHIEGVDQTDSVKFQCFYLINNQGGENGTFNVAYELNVSSISMEEIYIIVGLIVALLVIIIILLIFGSVALKIRKRRREKRRNKEERLSSFDSGISEDEDEISTIEGSYLINGHNENNDYGTLMSHPALSVNTISLDSRINSRPYRI